MGKIGKPTDVIKAVVAQHPPYHAAASVDTIYLFVRRAWRGMRTDIERVYGKRVRIEDVKDTAGVVRGHTIELHQPSRPLLRFLAASVPPTPTPQGPRHIRRRMVLARVDIAVDFWFRTQAEADAFQAFLRRHMTVKWKRRGDLWRDEPNGSYVIDWDSRGSKIARNALIYDLVSRHQHRVKATNMKIAQGAGPSLHAVRLELKLNGSRATRANSLTIRNLERIDVAHVFGRNIALLHPRPRYLQANFSGWWERRWRRFLYYELIPKQALLSSPISSALSVPQRLQ